MTWHTEERRENAAVRKEGWWLWGTGYHSAHTRAAAGIRAPAQMAAGARETQPSLLSHGSGGNGTQRTSAGLRRSLCRVGRGAAPWVQLCSPAARGWCGSSCAQGPAPARWELLAATRAMCWGPPSTPSQLCPDCTLPPTVSLPACPHRGPVDEPVGLLLAVDDNAVTLPPLLGRPVCAEEGGWQLGAAPSLLPIAISITSSRSPQLLPCLHDYEVPRVVDSLVQEVVVVLGSSSQVGTAWDLHPCPALGPIAAPARGRHPYCSPTPGELRPHSSSHAPLTFSCSIRSPCLRMFFLAR